MAPPTSTPRAQDPALLLWHIAPNLWLQPAQLDYAIDDTDHDRLGLVFTRREDMLIVQGDQRLAVLALLATLVTPSTTPAAP